MNVIVTFTKMLNKKTKVLYFDLRLWCRVGAQQMFPQKAAWGKKKPCRVRLCSGCAVPRCAGLCLAVPCRAVPCRAVSSCALLCHAMSCCAMPCCVLLCLALPFGAVPCCAVPFHAVPCHALPCHAVPCRTLAPAPGWVLTGHPFPHQPQPQPWWL